jgi:hypothetical protein
MPCDALARVNTTIATQTLAAELFRRPDVTPVVLRRLLLQLDGVVEAKCAVTGNRLTLDLTMTAEAIRLTVDLVSRSDGMIRLERTTTPSQS